MGDCIRSFYPKVGGGRNPCPARPPSSTSAHLLEQNSLGQGLLSEINAHLESQGLKLREETIVDATIIEAPSSTKNRAGERDPQMHQAKKGNQWHFGMKAHIGVDSETGIGHSMSARPANVHDVTEAHNPLHGGETVVWGHAGYQGVHKQEKNLGLAGVRCIPASAGNWSLGAIRPRMRSARHR